MEVVLGDTIWFTLQHQQLFTHHHVAKAIKVVPIYWKKIWLSLLEILSIQLAWN
jgi:hypothetical protein